MGQLQERRRRQDRASGGDVENANGWYKRDGRGGREETGKMKDVVDVGGWARSRWGCGKRACSG